MNKKQELKKKLEEREVQLHKAELESDGWNKGKYKGFSNASVSKILVNSLREDIVKLRYELKEL